MTLRPLGPRVTDLDHRDALLPETIMRHIAIASHHQCSGLGLTPEYTDATGLTRMSVEMKITRHAECGVGALLTVRSRIASIGRKSFATQHRIGVPGGPLVGTAEQLLLVVDKKTRRAVDVPDLIRAAFEAAAAGR